MNIYAPGGDTIQKLSNWKNNASRGQFRILELLFDNISGSTFDIIPQFDDYIRININKLNFFTSLNFPIDLSNTGIGGIVDGITFTAANARDFLIWGLANGANNEFSGFAVTHKPYSAFSTGTGNKGASSRSFTVTDAYQFTIGARVCVRNTNGTAPAYEWNWATITSITNSTTIVLTMDNEAYGTNITSATSGEILQWNMFRPYVVSASGQALYTPNYRLCGELHTDASGNVLRIYKSDECLRDFPVGSNAVCYSSTTVVSGADLYLGRWIPIWATFAAFQSEARATSASLRVALTNNRSSYSLLYNQTQIANISVRDTSGLISLDQYAHLQVYSNIDLTNGILVLNYYTPNGMRV